MTLQACCAERTRVKYIGPYILGWNKIKLHFYYKYYDILCIKEEIMCD